MCNLSCTTDFVNGILLGGVDCCSGCEFQGFKNIDTLPHIEWPYGRPQFHESCCLLFSGASYCDCKASAADEPGYGDW